MWPTIASPGIGVQHDAMVKAMPSVPRITTGAALANAARVRSAIAPLGSFAALPSNSWRATTAATRRPRPMSARISSCDTLVSLVSTSQLDAGTSVSVNSSWRAACASRRSPSSMASSRFIVRRKWRISERALPVRTKPSQAGLGRPTGPVTISTMSPLRSSVRSGWISPLIARRDALVADVGVDRCRRSRSLLRRAAARRSCPWA